MKTVIIIVAILLAAPFCSSVPQDQSQGSEQKKFFHVEIQSSADGGPRFSITNLSDKTLTACVVRFLVSAEGRSRLHMDWDALVQGGPDLRRGGQKPLEPGASMTMFLPHKVGGPLPDGAEIVAGIWADGVTFGEQDWLAVILSNRASLLSAYEQAISLLQKGLRETWTRNQYLAALNGKPDSLPMYSIRSTLQANQKLLEDPRSVQLAMRDLLASFTRSLALLRRTEPPSALQ